MDTLSAMRTNQSGLNGGVDVLIMDTLSTMGTNQGGLNGGEG